MSAMLSVKQHFVWKTSLTREIKLVPGSLGSSKDFDRFTVTEDLILLFVICQVNFQLNLPMYVQMKMQLANEERDWPGVGMTVYEESGSCSDVCLISGAGILHFLMKIEFHPLLSMTYPPSKRLVTVRDECQALVGVPVLLRGFSLSCACVLCCFCGWIGCTLYPSSALEANSIFQLVYQLSSGGHGGTQQQKHLAI